MPQSDGHLLVIPKALARNLLDAEPGGAFTRDGHWCREWPSAAKTAFAASGVIVTQFNEAPAGQTVFHLHIHVLPRYVGVRAERPRPRHGEAGRPRRQRREDPRGVEGVSTSFRKTP